MQGQQPSDNMCRLCRLIQVSRDHKIVSMFLSLDIKIGYLLYILTKWGFDLNFTRWVKACLLLYALNSKDFQYSEELKKVVPLSPYILFWPSSLWAY